MFHSKRAIKHKGPCLFGINFLFPNKNQETIQRTVMERKNLNVKIKRGSQVQTPQRKTGWISFEIHTN